MFRSLFAAKQATHPHPHCAWWATLHPQSHSNLPGVYSVLHFLTILLSSKSVHKTQHWQSAQATGTSHNVEMSQLVYLHPPVGRNTINLLNDQIFGKISNTSKREQF